MLEDGKLQEEVEADRVLVDLEWVLPGQRAADGEDVRSGVDVVRVPNLLGDGGGAVVIAALDSEEVVVPVFDA